MVASRRRLLICASGLLLLGIACSTFAGDEAPPADPDGGPRDGSSDASNGDTAVEAEAGAACDVPSTMRATDPSNATCAGTAGIDLLRDPLNCGTCGRSCSQCDLGFCPVEPLNGIGGRVLALTPSEFLIGQGDAEKVFRVPRAGGPAITVFTFGVNDYAQGIELDGDKVFVNGVRDVSVVAPSPDGGALQATALYSQSALRIGFGQTPADLFWVSQNSALVLMQKDGGNVRTLGDEPGGELTTGVAAEGGEIYWIRRKTEVPDAGTKHDIRRRAVNGSVKIWLDGLDDPRGLGVDATYVYWVAAGRREVLRALRTGPDRPTVVARWTDAIHTRTRSLHVGAEYLYWFIDDPTNPNDSLILRAPKSCGGDVVPILKAVVTSNYVTEGAFLYFLGPSGTFRVPR